LSRSHFSLPFYYGWVIVGIAFLSMGVWLAMRATFSVFLVVLLKEFNWSRAAAAGVQSLSFVVYTCSAPLVGMLIDRFGPRRVILPGIILLCVGLLLSAYVQTLFQFYLFYGVIAAFGVTFVSITAYPAILSHWFDTRRGLANGIAVSGMGIGTFTLVPLVQYVIGTMGWRFAFMVLSGLILLLLFPLSALFLRHKPVELGLRPDGANLETEPKRRLVEVIDSPWVEKDWTLKKVLREGRFWSLLAMGFLSIIPFYLILIHGATLLVDRGFDGMGAAFMIAFIGLTSSVFKIFWGWLSDHIGREITFSAGVGVTVLGVFFLLLFEENGSR
jgi:MFS family permease